MAIHITGDERADQVLTDSPFALLCGMLLDQQFPMERAFAGPAKVLERFGSLEPAEIAAADPGQFASLCSEPPAVHRFPGSMAERLQAVAQMLTRVGFKVSVDAMTQSQFFARRCQARVRGLQLRVQQPRLNGREHARFVDQQHAVQTFEAHHHAAIRGSRRTRQPGSSAAWHERGSRL